MASILLFGMIVLIIMGHPHFALEVGQVWFPRIVLIRIALTIMRTEALAHYLYGFEHDH